MKTSLWTVIFSVALGFMANAQQPAIPPVANPVATNRPFELAAIRAKAEKGDAAAQVLVGRQYASGNGVPQSFVEAVKWFCKAAEQGNTQAQVALGFCYAQGVGAAQDYVEAVKWYRKAATQGEADGQDGLGVCYEKGAGVAQDYTEAVRWYRMAADQGNALAQINLGGCYDQGCGVTQDYVEAMKWCRKAADQGDAIAQRNLGNYYNFGNGVPRDYAEAAKWYRKAANQGDAESQFNLGVCYEKGAGVAQDYTEAVRWYRMAADQGNALAQINLGGCYDQGCGVTQDYVEAMKWYRKAADQGDAIAQSNLGACYVNGNGVIKDYVQAYKWDDLAAAQDSQIAKQFLLTLEQHLTPEQIAEGQRLAREFRPTKATERTTSLPGAALADSVPTSSGTGFFITQDGFLVTAAHVVNGATQIRLVTGTGLLPARIVKLDTANDLALLKAEGRFSALPIISSRSVKLGNTIATVGFPNVGLQGFSPKLAKGEIASLTGTQDDPRYFQISVPVQPGNSGGALVDEYGNVVGVVAAKLNAATALATSGALPENVNYAVKSSFLLSFLESAPEVSAKLKEPNTTDRKFEDVVTSAEQSTILLLLY